MKIHVRVTDTDEEHAFTLPDQEDAYNRFLGNCLATIAVSRKGEFGFVGPSVEIRWIPDETIIQGEAEKRELINPDKYRVTRVLEMDKGKVIQERVIPEEESECEIGCTCIMCIPGA